MADDLLQTTFSVAFRDAEERKVMAEARRLEAEREAIEHARAYHIYDPWPYAEAAPHDDRMYEGTGIGFLYGLPACDHFAAELGDWRLGREPAVEA